MSVNDSEFDFEYDKPGAERSRRRRGEDDDIESDLEEELLGDDGWTSSKKPSEISDEELNDDLLQSDDEDHNISLGVSYEKDYMDDTGNVGQHYDEEQEYQHQEEEEYTEEYSQDHSTEMSHGQMDYSGEAAEGDDDYQDEVLDLEINEPIDEEFQDPEYTTAFTKKPAVEHSDQVTESPEEEEFVEDEVSSTAESSQVESEAVPEEESREESEEEDEDDEESGRSRFKSERKDGGTTCVRLADAGRKRSNIPETLELSEKAKADLREFEEQEERKRQGRYGRGRGGRGGRGRGGMPGYLPQDMRGNRRRMNDQRYPFMGNVNMQHPGSRMPPHPQHHPRLRGPPPSFEPGRPLVQQPLQPLMPPHMVHRSPPLRGQMEPPPRLMSPPPPGFPQHPHQPPPPQPKNIHINPHFRGPSTSVQVPLMPPAQSQPRPAVGPPRFPGQGDFQQHMSSGFGQPPRPPHHMEPFRSHPPPGPQDREHLFMGEHTDPAPFPGQPMFEHHGPGSLMSPNLPPPQVPGPTHMSFGPGPGFNQHGPLGLFQREPPRPSLPNQVHQPNHPRQFMGPRQPFGQPRNHFNVPLQYRMQPPHLQEPMTRPPHAAHTQQHHQQQPNEPPPMMHSGQNPFHPQQVHGSPRQSTPRSQNPQLRNMANRQRMNAPTPKQAQSVPHRNSNLREVPVAPGNTNMNSVRPVNAANAKATLGMPPGLNTRPTSGRGRGRGQVSAKARGALQTGGPGRAEAQNQSSSNTGTAGQDPDEDEETRQYRLKIEEQKRLREEILKRKEMRRQMQAGVRKKELLDRLHTNPQNQAPTQSQSQASAPQQPVPQPTPPQPQPRLPQQRPMAPRQQASTQGTSLSSNGAPKNLRANPPVRTRMPTVMGTNEAPQTQASASAEPPQRRTQIRAAPVPQNNTSLQTAGPRPGAKRTVMQRVPGAANDQGPVPPKVRMIKLSGTGERVPEATGVPVKEQVQNQGVQRKVTVAGQQQQSQTGSLGNPPQSRVVVSSRGRGRGRGGQVGAGRPLSTRQSQKAAEKGPATISIEGLSSSTTEAQLKNLLRSVGPIEMFKLIPQHRKAIARFSSPQHAASFQMSFHRHMIDLSHIDVSLIDG